MTQGVASVSAVDIAKHIAGTTGALGFLKWAEATLPAPIAAAVLKQAGAKSGGLARLGRLGIGTLRRPTRHLPRMGRLGRLGTLGDDTSALVSAELAGTTDASADTYYDTVAPVAIPTASATGATNAPASSSWTSSIGSTISNAIAAAGQAYLTVSQTQAANSILQTNLQRAQAGLAPLPYTPAQLGLTGPTLNLGVASTTLTPILLVGGGIVLLAMLLGGRRKSR